MPGELVGPNLERGHLASPCSLDPQQKHRFCCRRRSRSASLICPGARRAPGRDRIRVRESEKKSEGKHREESRPPAAKPFFSTDSTTRTAYPSGQQLSTNSSTIRPPVASSRPGPFIPSAPRAPGQISDAERERRRQQNLCFCCGSKEHGLARCPLSRFGPTNSPGISRPEDPKV